MKPSIVVIDDGQRYTFHPRRVTGYGSRLLPPGPGARAESSLGRVVLPPATPLGTDSRPGRIDVITASGVESLPLARCC